MCAFVMMKLSTTLMIAVPVVLAAMYFMRGTKEKFTVYRPKRGKDDAWARGAVLTQVMPSGSLA